MKLLFEKLIAKQNLTAQEMQTIMQECMAGQLADAQIAAFLVLMRSKGETIEELTTAAQVMLEQARLVNLGDNLIDIVGTGGDGRNTFNVSTVSSFVVAAAGVNVAKHGNISVSSRSGSADLLSQAGFKLDLNDEHLTKCLTDCGIIFLFGPQFHPALRFAKNARQQLGIRTFFNLLGPLLNPAQVKRQVIGVFNAQWQQPIAKVLHNLGSERAFVIHSQDGLDEVSICAPTEVIEQQKGKITSWIIDPKDYDCYHATLDKILVESPQQSLAMAQSVFNGEPGAARDIVVLNSAAALCCATDNLSFADAIIKAQQALDSGEALRRFYQLRDLTNEQ